MGLLFLKSQIKQQYLSANAVQEPQGPWSNTFTTFEVGQFVKLGGITWPLIKMLLLEDNTSKRGILGEVKSKRTLFEGINLTRLFVGNDLLEQFKRTPLNLFFATATKMNVNMTTAAKK